MTLLQAVMQSLARAARYHGGDVVAPAAVLWTDTEGQWRPVVDRLRPTCPQLLTLGEYDPATRTGPAIWLRCVIEPGVRAARFADLQWPEDATPIIYMPGVSRQTLRAVEECPDTLKPLVELQYRGTVWMQRNGRDWSVRAFLVNEEEGLGLDVAEDRHTTRAMLGALSQLAVTPVDRLRGNPRKRLEAEDFDRLMIGDPARDLLTWLSDPAGSRAMWDSEKWAAFRSRCREDYGFDPERDGELTAAEKLGHRQEQWYGVWERFTEAPSLYPGLPDLLRKAKPEGQLSFEREPWPDENEADEEQLRADLHEVAKMAPAQARRRLAALEAEHGHRRKWVWARLEMSPLAGAMQHLAVLADRTENTLGGDSPEAMGCHYAEQGHLADDAALRAMASVRGAEDVAAVHAVVRCIYLPWLAATAEHLQQQLAESPLPSAAGQGGIEAEAGECLLFVDGLRFDLAQRLVAMAGEKQLEVSPGWRWAALPSVTATAKPAVGPLVGQLRGGDMGSDFAPEVDEGGDRLNTDRFRKLLTAAGYQVLTPAEVGSPGEEKARAWTEFGEFDKLGHSLQVKLAARIDHQLDLLLERIESLLNAGWKRVRVVTDHGWLLMPGGLPKVDLPRYLAETRWSRCAAIRDSSQVDLPVAGWSWNPSRRFAYGPGIHCFMAGHEYAHGGASLQECVIPVLAVVSTAAPPVLTVSVSQVQWAGLRCRVSVEPVVDGLVADLRTRAAAEDSSIATEPRRIDSKGRAALLVADESLEGTAATLVILDETGRVLCKMPTTVGGDV